MDLDKYKHLAVRSDLGIIAWECIRKNQMELRQLLGARFGSRVADKADEILLDMVWGFGIQNWDTSKLVSNPMYFEIDSWIENQLYKKAYLIKKQSKNFSTDRS